MNCLILIWPSRLNKRWRWRNKMIVAQTLDMMSCRFDCRLPRSAWWMTTEAQASIMDLVPTSTGWSGMSNDQNYWEKKKNKKTKLWKTRGGGGKKWKYTYHSFCFPFPLSFSFFQSFFQVLKKKLFGQTLICPEGCDALAKLRIRQNHSENCSELCLT